jgi:beta-galactosidase
VKAGLATVAAAVLAPMLVLSRDTQRSRRASASRIGSHAFNTGWLFGGEYDPGAEAVERDDRSFTPITLPHTVCALSWSDWDPRDWQRVWIYRRHFDGAPLRGNRVFVDFDGIMVNAIAVLNDASIGAHRGGYLPWSVELTGHIVAGDNLLAIIVDARCMAVPPIASDHGPSTIDFLQPGGIYRDATLRVVPQAYVADVFARPVDVLTGAPSLDVECTVDVAIAPPSPATLTVELLDGERRLAVRTQQIRLVVGTVTAAVHVDGFGATELWSPDHPKLYVVRVTLAVRGAEKHSLERRIGFRDVSFRPDGFFLNGARLQIFGVNRHQLFPYLGMAAPERLQRRDAEILRRELNCNMVRCSHYPQSPHFLDACDELGLMVWQEPPGWVHLGGARWQEMVLQDVRDMIVRDRNRPSVIVWATRLDETGNAPALYAKTRRLAYELDGTRPTTGAMRVHSTDGWAQDVFGFDDYHGSDGGAVLLPPLPGVPYLVSETVGALAGPPRFRWVDSDRVLASQALMHAQVHDIAAADARYAGVLAWAGIDYASMNGGRRIWRSLKTPGVVDTFRMPKPGAAFYRSQVDPAVRGVILPTFSWGRSEVLRDGAAATALTDPNAPVMIATNCDRLEAYVDDVHVATGVPDARQFPYLAYPPVFVSLPVADPVLVSGRGDLRIDGYVRGQWIATVRMSADPSRDRLELTADNQSIEADGSDATRVTFRAVDAYGNRRANVTGDVVLSLSGPALLVSDNPFAFGAYGGVGGAFVQSLAGQTGTVTVAAQHRSLGRAVVHVTVTDPASGPSGPS